MNKFIIAIIKVFRRIFSSSKTKIQIPNNPYVGLKKKYLVCPGSVPSKNDGDYHFISAQQLMSLYGVSSEECVILKEGERGYFIPEDLIRLAPKYDGNYRIEV